MAVQIAKFQVTGTYALLTSNPSGMGGGNDKALGTKKIPTPEEEAETRLYKIETEAGRKCYGIRVAAFRGALLRAAMNKMKVGKEFASTLVKSTVFPTVEFTPILDPGTWKPVTAFVIDTRRAVIQRNGILRSRPKFEKWGAIVELEYDDDFLDLKNHLLPLMQRGGRIAGVGDYRPEKGGPFGRFTVETL